MASFTVGGWSWTTARSKATGSAISNPGPRAPVRWIVARSGFESVKPKWAKRPLIESTCLEPSAHCT